MKFELDEIESQMLKVFRQTRKKVRKNKSNKCLIVKIKIDNFVEELSIQELTLGDGFGFSNPIVKGQNHLLESIGD